jgi:hypothetical protein
LIVRAKLIPIEVIAQLLRWKWTVYKTWRLNLNLRKEASIGEAKPPFACPLNTLDCGLPPENAAAVLTNGAGTEMGQIPFTRLRLYE